MSIPPILISVFCRWCNQGFCVCRRCWRGQVYCSKKCRRCGYLKAHREAQRRYSQTEKGRKKRLLAENRRRHPELYPASKNMADDPSKNRKNMHTENPRGENSADFYHMIPSCCRFCGRIGEIKLEFPPRNYGNRVYDGNFRTM